MAYLIYKRNCSVSDALSAVRLARPIAQPNEGFMQQLEKYFAERNWYVYVKHAYLNLQKPIPQIKATNLVWFCTLTG